MKEKYTKKYKILFVIIGGLILFLILWMIVSYRKSELKKQFKEFSKEYPSLKISDSLLAIYYQKNKPSRLRNNPNVVHVTTSKGKYCFGADRDFKTQKTLSEILEYGDTLVKKVGVDTLVIKSANSNVKYKFKIYPLDE